MADKTSAKVLFVAFDAMELTLVEELVAGGKMPVVSKLLSGGAMARTRSSSDWFVASPWPTFYTSTTPAYHGIYHYLLWDKYRMAAMRPPPERQDFEPFWRNFEKQGLKTVVVDAPMVLPAPAPNQEGIEICGWCTHDTLCDPWVNPPSLANSIKKRGLQPMVLVEPYHLLNHSEVKSCHRQLNLTTSAISDLGTFLLCDHAWNFGLVSFTAPHMAGHLFWSDTGLTENVANADGSTSRNILENVYVECDHALGRLLDVVPDDTIVLVAALHGIEDNRNRGDLLSQMLRMMLAPSAAAAQEKFRPLDTIRKLVPERFRHAVKSRLPRSWQDWLTGFWRNAGHDWKKTSAFALHPDLQGYIRINVKGRERDGIVQPGSEYDALCEQIMRDIMTFVDADTGRPIVDRVVRADRLFPDLPQHDKLPDILVNWSKTPCAHHREIKSPFGDIPWPTPGRNFDGRSGNHSDSGFLIVKGPGIKAGLRIPVADIKDLAPTISELLGVPPLDHFQGVSIVDQLRDKE